MTIHYWRPFGLHRPVWHACEREWDGVEEKFNALCGLREPPADVIDRLGDIFCTHCLKMIVTGE